MELGVIGMGLTVLNLVQTAANSGYTIYVHNPFGNHLLTEIFATNKKIKLVSLAKAAAPEIIILFIPLDNLETILKRLPDMSTKIILHAGCPVFNSFFPSFAISQNSATFKISQMMPKSYVIKLYHEIPTDSRKVSKLLGTKTKIYFSGENCEANNKVKQLLETLDISGIDLNDWTNMI